MKHCIHFAFLILLQTIFSASAFAQITADEILRIDHDRIIREADQYMKMEPVTITAASSPRSSGGLHDYFSEGDYWWPDSSNPDGPYIQRDGETNPANFVAHREALIRFSVQVASLTSAWIASGYRCYAEHAVQHLKAWFINPDTRMNPHLLYAQAIKGKVTGRGTGIIDSIHLIEIALSVPILEESGALSKEDASIIRKWFSDYLTWMTTHKYGTDERDSKNNHATCWVLQASAFAGLTGNTEVLAFCSDRFKTVLLPDQMSADGSFPLEMKRTKPYGYSLFNCEIMSGICQLLSAKDHSLWDFSLSDGRSMKKGMEFIYPYIADKSAWPYKHDVMYYDNWPVRQSALLFCGNAYGNNEWIALWNKLDPSPTVPEIVRNFPIRNPLLWLAVRPALPQLAIIDPWTVYSNRIKYTSGELTKNTVIKRLLKIAARFVKVPPSSVVEKNTLPPSGDRHDYMSVAPYWWPDSSKKDGLPYIRKDGETNPDRSAIGDRKRLGEMIKSVNTLALAWSITGDSSFAEQCGKILKIWFLDTATRMNPNLRYAQSIRGRNEGRGAGIIDSYGFAELVDAVALLPVCNSWTKSDLASLREWFTQYLGWLMESENGRNERAAKNNHGTAWDVQVSAIACFTGRYDIAKTVISALPAKRIATQIEPDGTEPYELTRTKTWGYSCLNLEALMRAGLIGDRLGIDIWNYSTPDGRNIRKVVDWLLPYALGSKRWDYRQIVPFENARFIPILRIAAWKFADPAYTSALDRIPGTDDESQFSALHFPEYNGK